MKKIPFALLFLWANLVLAQVKVGDDINTIDPASILELESASKVFVVTRVTTPQMNAITPLNGALVYNTDENCLYQYRNDAWTSLCIDVMASETITALIDNNDGTFTYNNESGAAVIISKAGLINNGDGTYTFSNGASNLTIDTNASAIPYDNTSSTLSATNAQDAIDELKASLNVDNVTITGNGTTSDPFKIEDDGVNSAKILNGTVIAEDIADGTISNTKLDKTNIPISGFGPANAAVSLGGNTLTDVADPTAAQDAATKNYVDGQIAAAADDDITSATLSPTSVLTINEGTTFVDVNLTDLEESADILAEEARALAAEAANAGLIAINTTDIAANTAGITTNASNLAFEETRAVAAEAAIQTDVDANEVAANAAIALKEDSANKSTDGTLADNSDTDFPTEQAVKTYVDTQVGAITTDDDITAATLSAASLLTINEGATSVDVSLAALEESADIAAVQADVDANEADADAAITAVQNNLNTHTTADQDLSDTNEIQVLSKTGTLISLSNGGGSINETTTSLTQNTTTGVISYSNEATTSQTANVLAAETDNSLSIGANGGVLYESPIKAFGKISAAGAVTKSTTGISVTKLAGNGHYRVTLPAGITSDANYIIQLTQPGRGGAGNDDPGISYSNQTTTTFEVIIGDNDNGGTDRNRFNSEFMFTILDL